MWRRRRQTGRRGPNLHQGLDRAQRAAQRRPRRQPFPCPGARPRPSHSAQRRSRSSWLPSPPPPARPRCVAPTCAALHPPPSRACRAPAHCPATAPGGPGAPHRPHSGPGGPASAAAAAAGWASLPGGAFPGPMRATQRSRGPRWPTSTASGPRRRQEGVRRPLTQPIRPLPPLAGRPPRRVPGHVPQLPAGQARCHPAGPRRQGDRHREFAISWPSIHWLARRPPAHARPAAPPTAIWGPRVEGSGARAALQPGLAPRRPAGAPGRRPPPCRRPPALRLAPPPSPPCRAPPAASR